MPLKARSAGGAAASRQLTVAGGDLFPSLKCSYSQKATLQLGVAEPIPLPTTCVRFAWLEALLVPPTPG